jgi:hypothetical protein
MSIAAALAWTATVLAAVATTFAIVADTATYSSRVTRPFARASLATFALSIALVIAAIWTEALS